MKRRVVQLGLATLMVSLPSKWAKKHNLVKGDEIDLDETEGKLVISSSRQPSNIKKESINVAGLSPLVNRFLISLYIKGLDEIEVFFDNAKEVKDFQERVLLELIGFEIVKSTTKSFILKDIAGNEKKDIDELIQRLFYVLKSMSEELVAALESKGTFENVIDTDRTINRITNLCLRTLNKQGYVKTVYTSQIYALITLLEDIGDAYKRIAKEAPKKEERKELLRILQETQNLLQEYPTLFQQFDKQKIVNCAKKYESIKSALKVRSKTGAHIILLLDSIIKINNHLLVISL